MVIGWRVSKSDFSDRSGTETPLDQSFKANALNLGTTRAKYRPKNHAR